MEGRAAEGPDPPEKRAPFITSHCCIQGPRPTSGKRARSDAQGSPRHTLYFVPHDTRRFLQFCRAAALPPHPDVLWLLEREGYRVVTYGFTIRYFGDRFKEEFLNALGPYKGFRVDDSLRFEVAPDSEPTVQVLERVLKQALELVGKNVSWLNRACGLVPEARGEDLAHSRALLLQRMYLLGMLPLLSGASTVAGWKTETALVSPLAWELLCECGGDVAAPFMQRCCPSLRWTRTWWASSLTRLRRRFSSSLGVPLLRSAL